MLDQTGASAARLVAGAFPELDEHSTILSLVGEFGFRFGVHSGFLPSALPKHIDSLVNGMFTSSEAGQALSLLNTITDDNTNAEAMRTRLAALQVSAGSAMSWQMPSPCISLSAMCAPLPPESLIGPQKSSGSTSCGSCDICSPKRLSAVAP